MKQKIYYIKNITAEKPIYADLQDNRYLALKKNGSSEVVINLLNGKDVTDEYDYICIPRVMTKNEIEGRVEIKKCCPGCGKLTSIYLNGKELDKYSWYTDSRLSSGVNGRPVPLIQELFRERTKEERELMMTGYCYRCQEKIFGQDEFILTTEAEFSMDSGQLIARNCAAYDGYRWSNMTYTRNEMSGYLIKEMNEFFAFIFEDQFSKGISDIGKLLKSYGAELSEDQVYHLFCEGTYCNFDVRLSNWKQDYSVYIRVYNTEE